jgi:hypothetical protein
MPTSISSYIRKIPKKLKNFFKGHHHKHTYLHIPEGHGGTYTFPSTSTSTSSSSSHSRYIGTSQCLSCVGVYFAIDSNRCFAAHIRASIGCGGGKSGRSSGLAVEDQEAYSNIYHAVQNRLEAESRKSGWGRKTEWMRKSLVMVCSQLPYPGEERLVAGQAVADAVSDWLEIPEGEKGGELRRFGAFVVRHPGKVKVLCEGLLDGKKLERSTGDTLEGQEEGVWRIEV